MCVGSPWYLTHSARDDRTRVLADKMPARQPAGRRRYSSRGGPKGPPLHKASGEPLLVRGRI